MATEIHTLLIDPFLKKLAKYAIEKDASDLHISTNNFVFIREVINIFKQLLILQNVDVQIIISTLL